jgi:hypothetical protein
LALLAPNRELAGLGVVLALLLPAEPNRVEPPLPPKAGEPLVDAVLPKREGLLPGVAADCDVLPKREKPEPALVVGVPEESVGLLVGPPKLKADMMRTERAQRQREDR